MPKNTNSIIFAALTLLALGAVNSAHADWLDQVSHWLKLGRTPREMRAPSDASQTGDILIAAMNGGEPRAVTDGGGFRSPVFLPDGETLLALRGDDLIRMPASGGQPELLYHLAEVVRLLGINQENNDLLLLLLKKGSNEIELGELQLSSGQIKRLPNDPDNPAHRLMLERLRGDDREYDGMSVYLQSESKARLGGQIEWTDIYIKQGRQPPTNISRCAGSNCSQPSFSFDSSQVVFIRSNEND